MFSLVSTIVLVCIIVYIGIWRNMTRYVEQFAGNGDYLPSKAAGVVLKLVMVYSFAIGASFIPYLTHLLFINIVGLKNELLYFTPNNFSLAAVILIYFKDLVAPMRGYIHAMAVYYVYKSSSAKSNAAKRLMGNMLMLNSAQADKDTNNQDKLEEVDLKASPKWSFSFRGENMLQSVSISKKDTDTTY
jgi:hypothetical protein